MIKNPISTEKAIRMLNEENKLVFIVDRKAKKPEVKKAIEEIYKVKVIKVNTTILPSGKKKAYLKLAYDTPAIDIATQLGLM